MNNKVKNLMELDLQANRAREELLIKKLNNRLELERRLVDLMYIKK